MGAEIDYTSIINNTQTSGDNKVVSLRFPAENTEWFLAGDEALRHTGSSVTVTFPDAEEAPWTTIWITLAPGEGDRLSVFGLKTGTPLQVNMDVRGQILYGGAWEYFLRYYDADGNFIRMDRNQTHFTEYQDYTSLQMSELLSIPYNAATFEFGFLYVGGQNEIDTGTASMDITALSVSVTVSAEDFDSGVLGSIVSGTPGQNQAAGDIKDKQEDVTGKLDDALSGLEAMDKPEVNVNMGVNSIVTPQYQTLLTNTLKPIATNAIVAKLLVATLTVMLAAYILFGKKG